MIRVSRDGVSFSYYGDVITRRWPWVKGPRYVSSLHATDFNHFRDYWQTVGEVGAMLRSGKSDDRVVGVGMHEVLCDYVHRRYPGEYVAVLCNINPEAKDGSFWRRMPKQQAEQLLKDVAVFRCNSRQQMLELTYGTTTDFAVAYAVENGILVDCNLWGSV